MTESTHRFEAARSLGEVSAVMKRPASARWLFVMGHGAGAGMRHSFLERMTVELAARDVASFRYQYPYMEADRRRPDHRSILTATVRSAVTEARRLADDLPLIAGGKSMGGRMTSMAAAQEPLPHVAGLAFLGFPLHPAAKPGTERSEHLFEVDLPMLFLQGDRDRLAGLDLLESVCARLGPRATLHVVEGGDHSFAVLKRSGRTEGEVMTELAETLCRWFEGIEP